MTTSINIFNIGLVFIAVIGVLTTENIQRMICKFCALLCAVLPILLMIDSLWHFDGTASLFNITQDKVSAYKTVKPYLTYLLLFLVFSIIKLRQIVGSSGSSEYVFENITKEDTEKDTKQLFKYFMNYGFYRFGYEVRCNKLKSYIPCNHGVPRNCF